MLRCRHSQRREDDPKERPALATPPIRILRNLPLQAIAAVVSALALVLVLILAPSAAKASAVFESLRTPGEAGFVAAHRGRVGRSENTLAAMRLALAGPASFIETDLQLTSDGIPVLMHDWTIDRTTDGTGPVWSHTFEELSRLDAGSWFGQDFAGVRVPSLAQLLAILCTQHQGRPAGNSRAPGTGTRCRAWWTRSPVPASRAGDPHQLHTPPPSRSLREVASDLPRAVLANEVIADPAALSFGVWAVAIISRPAFLDRDPAAVDRIHARRPRRARVHP